MVHEWLGMIQERLGMIRNWFGRIPEGFPMIQDWFGMIPNWFAMIQETSTVRVLNRGHSSLIRFPECHRALPGV